MERPGLIIAPQTPFTADLKVDEPARRCAHRLRGGEEGHGRGGGRCGQMIVIRASKAMSMADDCNTG